MIGRHRNAWHLCVSMVLAAVLATVPVEWVSLHVVASDACTLTDDIRATTCRLRDGVAAEGALDPVGGSATYRVDVFSEDATLDLVLNADSGGKHLSVLDWRGAALGEATQSANAPDLRLSARLPLPGTYGVRVSTDSPSGPSPYRLKSVVTYAGLPAQPLWPLALSTGDGSLAGERQIARTPRGGTPTGGVAVARALRAPPEGEVGDFTMAADVQFEQILGPSALTVRFRYEPEAGGGTGYLLSLDPFGGTATLDSFDEGQRRPIVGHVPLSVTPTESAPNRLIVQADGPSIRVTLDGQPVLEARDDRYPRGLIVVGAVTWSDPVAVTFDHIQVTAPPR
jgi:hypothetical protein